MGHRAHRAQRKLKQTLQSGRFDAEALRRLEIALMFGELDGTGALEERCFQEAVRSCEHSRAYRARLREHPVLYRAYLDRQNALRKARPRSVASLERERERKRAWEAANRERLRKKRQRRVSTLKREQPALARARYEAKYQRDRERPDYKARNCRNQKNWYAKVRATDPERYARILERARESNRRRKARVRADEAKLVELRAYDRERMRRRRADARQARAA